MPSSQHSAILSSLDYQQEYGATCITEKGEKVKSKAEKLIADYLFQNNLRYEYERPAFTRGWIFHDKISNPDFYLNDFDVYVEYWGLVNAKDVRVGSEYTRVMKWKMAQYYDNKIKFISIYPTNLENLDWIFRAKLKDVAGVIFMPQKSPSANNVRVQGRQVVNNEVIKQLGRYYDRLEIITDTNGIKLRLKACMKKEEWNDVNEILQVNGFTWQSNGKDSCWIKMLNS